MVHRTPLLFSEAHDAIYLVSKCRHIRFRAQQRETLTSSFEKKLCLKFVVTFVHLEDAFIQRLILRRQ